MPCSPRPSARQRCRIRPPGPPLPKGLHKRNAVSRRRVQNRSFLEYTSYRSHLPLATIGKVAGVYISYPFCAQKCTYCNFASGVFPRELEDRYLDVLISELRSTEWPWVPETVYLGGGTPSQMAIEALASILAAIPGGRSSGATWPEATMEAAPGGLSSEKSAAWHDAGINRVSLGVQSFVQKELARTGRRHTAEIVEHEI